MDPATIQAIAEASGALFSYLEAGNVDKWREKVNGKINYIILQNMHIIELLQELRDLIPVELLKAFRDHDINQCDGFLDRLAAYREDIPLNIKNGAFLLLQTQVEQWTSDVCRYGPAVFPSVFAGTQIVSSIYRTLNTGRAQRRNWVENFVKKFEFWASSYEGSILSGIAELELGAREALAKVESSKGRRTIASIDGGNRKRVGHGGDGGDVFDFCSSSISANIEISDDFAVKVADVRQDDPTCRTDFRAEIYAEHEKMRVQRTIEQYKSKADNLESMKLFYQLLLDCTKKLRSV
ncbi:hypothetical protein [Mesorhizobium sp. Cs1321R2N1]|uniref:hypothetical protein n=1 Tax=Mesorhizobium sp. Cs1321R2N1 TaxID=3015174 RepID=UPI00301E2A47